MMRLPGLQCLASLHHHRTVHPGNIALHRTTPPHLLPLVYSSIRAHAKHRSLLPERQQAPCDRYAGEAVNNPLTAQKFTLLDRLGSSTRELGQLAANREHEERARALRGALPRVRAQFVTPQMR